MDFFTPRCHIRRFIDKDIDAFMQYRNNEDWMKFQSFKGCTKEEYSKVLLREPCLTTGTQLAIVSNDSCELIGDLFILRENDECFVGYTISPQKARQGYAYEVVLSVMQQLKTMGILVVKAGVVSENTASIKLLKKLGFTFCTTEDDEDIYCCTISD